MNAKSPLLLAVFVSVACVSCSELNVRPGYDGAARISNAAVECGRIQDLRPGRLGLVTSTVPNARLASMTCKSCGRREDLFCTIAPVNV